MTTGTSAIDDNFSTVSQNLHSKAMQFRQLPNNYRGIQSSNNETINSAEYDANFWPRGPTRTRHCTNTTTQLMSASVPIITRPPLRSIIKAFIFFFSRCQLLRVTRCDNRQHNAIPYSLPCRGPGEATSHWNEIMIANVGGRRYRSVFSIISHTRAGENRKWPLRNRDNNLLQAHWGAATQAAGWGTSQRQLLRRGGWIDHPADLHPQLFQDLRKRRW